MRGVRIDADVKDEIVERYNEGQSIRQIAKKLEISYGVVWNVLHQAGVTIRSRGGNNRTKKA